jgi:predicted outer membrane protein
MKICAVARGRIYPAALTGIDFLFSSIMKFYAFSFFLALHLYYASQPQDLPAGVRLAPMVQPPAIVISRLAEEFHVNNPEWKQAGELYYVNLSEPSGKSRVVYYNRDGKKVRTDSLLAGRARPRAITNFLVNYDGVDTRRIWIRKDSALATYYAPSDTDTLWFDHLGRLQQNKSGRNKISEDELLMLRKAASLLLFEGSMAELALVNATSDEIRNYARRTRESSHSAFTGLEKVGSALGTTLPRALTGKLQDEYLKMGRIQGGDFERKYQKTSEKNKRRFKKLLRQHDDDHSSPVIQAWARNALSNFHN